MRQQTWVVMFMALLGMNSFALVDKAGQAEPPARPDEPEVEHVDFERHIATLFSRFGCNSGMCHGSFQGQGGFRLSLFGQSPQQDYEALMARTEVPRVDRTALETSLLLTKPSGREEHGGGILFHSKSWEYGLIRRWIEDGARHVPGSGAVGKLVLQPDSLSPLTIGQIVPLKAVAHFHDGHQEEVTLFSEFRCRDESIAEVNQSGVLTARAAGATALVVSYRGAFASLPVLVPFPANAESPVRCEPANIVDVLVDKRIQQLALTASPPTTDNEFLRRATLDVLATLPTPEDILRFEADRTPFKRERFIDRVLAHPRRAAVWATKLCDMTGCHLDTLEVPEGLRTKRAKMWHDWFRQRFANNVHYDEIVHGVLCATSRQAQPVETWIDEEATLIHAAEVGFESDYADRPSLDLFWRRIGPSGQVAVEDLAELTASAFLGLRLHCARCHHHPYDQWSQRDFAGYAAIFDRVQFGSSTALRTAMNHRLAVRRQARDQGQSTPELPRVQEVFLSATRRPLGDAALHSDTLPQAPHGPTFADEADPREALFRWLTRPDNPYFAKNVVNRVWAKYFGLGLVEPVDSMAASNPSTCPELLDRLATEFVRSGYDLAQLERLILTSQAYQRSSCLTGNNAGDRDRFARAAVRPLPAETLVDALNMALETSEDFGPDVPAGSQAIELAPSRFSNRRVNDLFRILGRGDRKSLCDCDRSPSPSIRQAIHLMSDAHVMQMITTGRLARLLSEKHSDADIVEEFYLATFSRSPDDEERALVLQHVSESDNRAEALADLVWALINSREFVTNH